MVGKRGYGTSGKDGVDEQEMDMHERYCNDWVFYATLAFLV